YAGLAHAYNVAADWGWDVPGVTYDSLGPLATRAARRAIALDSLTSETWLGAAMGARSDSPALALDYNRSAVRIDSASIGALHQQAAAANLTLGRWAAARAAAARAVELGDVPAPNRALVAIASLGGGDTARARAAIDSLGSTLRGKLRRSPSGLSRTDAGY